MVWGKLLRVTVVYCTGAADAVVCEHHALGGEGAVELAKAVIKATEKPPHFEFLYELDLPIKVNIPWLTQGILQL
jgi:methylenetetrahydrofolate dehydrogenase (NADP+)/methenyltetrahydrofolate cyclohydrolase/formyltetrahydrofolate synthetase